MAAGRDFMVLIRMRTDDRQDKDAARQRLHNWLETFGHTSVSHGFDFLETVSFTQRGKRVASKKKARPSHETSREKDSAPAPDHQAERRVADRTAME